MGLWRRRHEPKGITRPQRAAIRRNSFMFNPRWELRENGDLLWQYDTTSGLLGFRITELIKPDGDVEKLGEEPRYLDAYND